MIRNICDFLSVNMKSNLIDMSAWYNWHGTMFQPCIVDVFFLFACLILPLFCVLVQFSNKTTHKIRKSIVSLLNGDCNPC